MYCAYPSISTSEPITRNKQRNILDILLDLVITKKLKD